MLGIFSDGYDLDKSLNFTYDNKSDDTDFSDILNVLDELEKED